MRKMTNFRVAAMFLMATGAAWAGEAPAGPYIIKAGSGIVAAANGGVVNNGRKAATLTLDLPLAAEARVDFAVMIPKGRVAFRTGRGAEAFSVARGGESISWECTAPDGKRLDNGRYDPNGQIRPGFAYTEAMSGWNEYFTATRRRDIGKEFFPIAFEVADGSARAYLDGILLAEWPAAADLFGNRPTVELPAEAVLKDAAARKLPHRSRDFFPVDLSVRMNSDAPPIADNGAVVVDGVPFEIAPSGGVVDLGRSWFREGNLQGHISPRNDSQASFGGRWRGALNGSPTRLQFRAPYRQYDALYLLASCEERDDRVNRVTAQFYRPSAGFPKNFTGAAVPDGAVRVIRIPLEPGALREFSDLPVIELELTGDVHVFRGYPDPSYYSVHGAGTPSGVQVYAMTLGIAPLEVEFEPEAFGNLWVEPGRPAYLATVANRTAEAREARLALRTESFDGGEKLELEQTLRLEPGASVPARFDLPLEKFGWHRVVLDVDGRRYERGLALLRRREYTARPFDAKGFMFGFWNNRGQHHTPSNRDGIRLMGPMGMESSHGDPAFFLEKDVDADLRKYGMKTFWAYRRGGFPRTPGRSPWPASEEIAAILRDKRVAPSPVSEPAFVHLFSEPGGLATDHNRPEFFGEPEVDFNDAQRQRFEEAKRVLGRHIPEIRRDSPDAKVLVPWGDPLYAVPFLQDPGARELFDGVAFDTGYFERLPEQQIHQCSLHRMFQFHEYWKRHRLAPPLVVSVEGPHLSPVLPGALSEEQSAAHLVRGALILGAYGVNRQFAISSVADCASYWGEQHYGSGLFSRLNDLNPHVGVASVGTMIRHLRHMEFAGWIPLGSLSAYCLEFKDSRNGEKLYVMWTIRGRRPVRMRHGPVFDAMDNRIANPVLTQMPIFVYGGDGEIALGEPDHSDAVLAPDHLKLGRAADLFVRQSQDDDDEYVNSFARAIRRFPAPMTLETLPEGLAITLPPQDVDRGIMPYYATLHPAAPIAIPGKATHISMEVAAASDWGRIVYVLRDAKGEKWISVGSKNKWSGDDNHSASYFNFDGKRLVRFELPSHLSWDDFREMGTTWWGASGGDNIVDLPLSLEKIFVERRAKAMYVNSLEPASAAPVVLGDLYVEYASPEMMAAEIPAPRMPASPVGFELFNPIAELAARATLPASEITGVEQPDQQPDGTRGVFAFREVEGAVRYDIYIGRRPDGAGALKMGDGLRESGALLRGFLADADFYAFMVYYNRGGGNSAPSEGFKFNLPDEFANK